MKSFFYTTYIRYISYIKKQILLQFPLSIINDELKQVVDFLSPSKLKTKHGTSGKEAQCDRILKTEILHFL